MSAASGTANVAKRRSAAVSTVAAMTDESRREREVLRYRDQKRYCRIDPAGARSGKQVLHGDVADKDADAESRQKQNSGAAVLGKQEQDARRKKPYQPRVAEEGDLRHEEVQKGAF